MEFSSKNLSYWFLSYLYFWSLQQSISAKCTIYLHITLVASELSPDIFIWSSQFLHKVKFEQISCFLHVSYFFQTYSTFLPSLLIQFEELYSM